jgi:hypothetical protein
MACACSWVTRAVRVRAHGVAGVDRQVHHRGLQLAAVGAHLRQVAAVVGGELDVLVEHAPQQHLELADQLAQVENLALHGLLAREGQQLAHQVGGPRRGLLDLVQSLVGRIAHRVAGGQHVELHEDGGEQVVEVVRHAAGQLADGLHLLALRELQLDLLLLGDVHQIGHPAAPLFRPGALGEIEVGDAGRVVGQAHLHRGPGPLARGQLLGGVGAAGGLDQVAERLALLAAAGHRLQRRVGLDDLGFERIFPVQQGRAEGRGRGEGVEHLGRRAHGA